MFRPSCQIDHQFERGEGEGRGWNMFNSVLLASLAPLIIVQMREVLASVSVKPCSSNETLMMSGILFHLHFDNTVPNQMSEAPLKT